MRIAYLTGEYPRATDTFISREVTTLRSMGVDVHTFSVRCPGDEHMVGVEQKQERDRTFYILQNNLINLLLAHLSLLLASPKRYLQTIKLAWSTSQPGFLGFLYQLFYFIEAGILAQQIKQRQIVHLHNHIAEASGTVAMLAASIGGFSYSFTLHGPYIFFRGYQWRLYEKIRRSLFVSCISNYARSQGMIFAPIEKWNQMHIIHCGIDPALFDVVSHNMHSKRLLFVGRLAVAKGLPILLESLAILKQTHPDILLTVVGDGPTLCGAKHNRPKIVVFIHNINRPRGRLASKLFDVANRIDLFVTGFTSQAEFLRNYLGLPENRIYLLSSPPIDTSFFTPGLSSDKKLRPVIASGGMEKRDYRTLAAATEDLNVDVKICAFSRNAIAQKKTFPKIIPNNMSHGFYDWCELVQLYRDSDLVVITMFENNYQAGLTTMFEAMACRRPIVITRSSGIIGELINSGIVTGVNIGDSNELKQTIVKLLNEPQKTEIQAQRGYELVLNQFNHNSFNSSLVTKLLSTFESVNNRSFALPSIPKKR